MSALAQVLCGPMLRRVEEGRCVVWIATSTALDLTLRVRARDSDAPIGSSASRRVRLGQNVFVHLVEARVQEAGFPRDTLLEYDLLAKGRSILDESVRVPGFDRPTFVVPSATTLLYAGSCRKPHGGIANAEDALASAYSVLCEDASSLSARPAALMLLGDQIYADDVAAPLLLAVKAGAAALLGFDESIVGIGPVGEIAYGRRWDVIQRIGLTTGHAEHHLLSFGEFLAMYFAVYGGYCADLPSVESMPPQELAQQARTEYESDLAKVRTFLKTAREKVRPLLANVPSYAIFDDHEITDDWNLDRQAADAVREDPAAAQVVANGLCAYWAVHGWGNNPDAFGDSFIETVEAGLGAPVPPDQARQHSSHARQAMEEQLLRFREWHFVTATNPPIVFLDSRTQRRYVGVLGVAQLLGPKGRDWLRTAISRCRRVDPSAPLIIVTATPVLGHVPLEWLQGVGRRLFRSVLEATDLDFESWIAQREGYFELMRTLLDAGVTRSVFVSGDVHYGFVKEGRFSQGSDACEILQVTSSALNNVPPNAVVIAYLTLLSRKVERRVGFLSNRVVNKVKRWLRPFTYDIVTYFGLWKPSSDDVYLWWDEGRLLPLGRDRARVITSPHFVALHLEAGRVTRVEFRDGEAGQRSSGVTYPQLPQ